MPAGSAVVFVDLNGLKQTNDKQGHEFGDRLLQKAAGVLKKTFSNGEIYRAGGDEFMVIVDDISEEELKRVLDGMEKYRLDAQEVSLAVGYCCSDGNIDIRQAMSTADKRMYEDKKRYYDKVNIRTKQ